MCGVRQTATETDDASPAWLKRCYCCRGLQWSQLDVSLARACVLLASLAVILDEELAHTGRWCSRKVRSGPRDRDCHVGVVSSTAAVPGTWYFYYVLLSCTAAAAVPKVLRTFFLLFFTPLSPASTTISLSLSRSRRGRCFFFLRLFSRTTDHDLTIS